MDSTEEHATRIAEAALARMEAQRCHAVLTGSESDVSASVCSWGPAKRLERFVSGPVVCEHGWQAGICKSSGDLCTSATFELRHMSLEEKLYNCCDAAPSLATGHRRNAAAVTFSR